MSVNATATTGTATGRSTAFAVNHVVDISTSINSTGTGGDVTAAINAAIAACQPGTWFRFVASGVYRVDKQLVPSVPNMFLDMQGATFQTSVSTPYGTSADSARSWWDAGANHLRFRNGTYHGANALAGATNSGAYVPALEHQHGFNLLGQTDIQIWDCAADHIYGDFIYYGAAGTTPCSSMWAYSNVFTNNGRMGISIVAGIDITVEHNTINEVRQTLMDFEPNGTSTPMNDIKRCVFRANGCNQARLNFISAAGQNDQMFDITIESNTVDGSSLVPRSMNSFITGPGTGARRGRLIYNNNTSTYAWSQTSPPTDITISNWDTVTATGNTATFTGSGTMTLFTFSNCTGVICRKNVITNGVESNLVLPAISAVGIPSASTINTPTGSIVVPPQIIAATGRASTLTFGTPTLSATSAGLLHPAGIPSGSTVNATAPVATIQLADMLAPSTRPRPQPPGRVAPGGAGFIRRTQPIQGNPQTIQASAIPPNGTLTNEGGAAYVSTGGFVYTQERYPTIGRPSLTRQLTVHASGITSGATVGVPHVKGPSTIRATAIGSTVTFGVPNLNPNLIVIHPAGIASTVRFGVIGAGAIFPAGIPSGSTVGMATVTIAAQFNLREPASRWTAGFPHGRFTVGAPDELAEVDVPTYPGPVGGTLSPVGIASTATVGKPVVTLGALTGAGYGIGGYGVNPYGA